MLEQVKDYYGKTLASSDDLQTDACCMLETPPEHIKAILSKIHDEVMMKYYGCGLVAPELLDGLRILDLGSGSGRDAYVLSSLVGEHGFVAGVDMTEEQLAVARRHIQYHTESFGYQRANIDFYHGYIEKLDQLDFDDNSFDIIVSNCVINLSEDKNAVLEQAYRLLKPGGEMYFSDVYADRRIPQTLVQNPLLYGECLSGALYWNDFIQLAKRNGFLDPRLVNDRPLCIENPDIDALIGHINFYSATYRLFKIDQLEPACEDYGQAVIYKGSIEHLPESFCLDSHHCMPTGKVFPVCGNTWLMLHESRFKPHFEFIGNWDKHFGIFEGCGTPVPFANTNNAIDPVNCC